MSFKFINLKTALGADYVRSIAQIWLYMLIKIEVSLCTVNMGTWKTAR